MNRSSLALALALGVIPVTALGQDANAASPTSSQPQAVRQTFQQFFQQALLLHQQMRGQMLSALSPVHRRSVAAIIGQLAIAPNPDVMAAAKQLDATLSPAEQQRIISAGQSFATQSRQLRDQLRTQLQSEMPAGEQPDFMKHASDGGIMAPHQLDAGTMLLMGLSPHPMLDMGMHGWPGMMHMEGAPPQ